MREEARCSITGRTGGSPGSAAPCSRISQDEAPAHSCRWPAAELSSRHSSLPWAQTQLPTLPPSLLTRLPPGLHTEHPQGPGPLHAAGWLSLAGERGSTSLGGRQQQRTGTCVPQGTAGGTREAGEAREAGTPRGERGKSASTVARQRWVYSTAQVHACVETKDAPRVGHYV